MTVVVGVVVVVFVVVVVVVVVSFRWPTRLSLSRRRRRPRRRRYPCCEKFHEWIPVSLFHCFMLKLFLDCSLLFLFSSRNHSCDLFLFLLLQVAIIVVICCCCCCFVAVPWFLQDAGTEGS